MGCAPSCGPASEEPPRDEFAPPPPIPVDIGSGVRKTPHNDKAVIFIFGILYLKIIRVEGILQAVPVHKRVLLLKN